MSAHKIETSWPLSFKLVLLTLTLLYGLGAVAAFLVILKIEDSPLRSRMMVHLLSHGAVMVSCGIAFLLAAFNNAKTRLATTISLVITGFFLWGSLLSGIKTGFNIFYLIEPLVVLPSLIFVGYKLALSRIRKDDAECSSKDQ